MKIILGDTDVVNVGGGSHSGRSMRHAATVFSKAAADLIAEASRSRPSFWDRRRSRSSSTTAASARARPTAPSISSSSPKEAARHDLPDELKDGIAVVTDNEMHDPVFPNGCAICEVEIDPDTGAMRITRYASVDDVGRCINPLIVHGQTHGGIAQGVGQAMWEQCYIEPDSGQPLIGSLMDYGMPRADTMPSFKTEIAEVLSPTNPLGIKAGGEGGTTGAPAVVVSAIVDALRDYGVRDITMPATPYNIWRDDPGRQDPGRQNKPDSQRTRTPSAPDQKREEERMLLRRALPLALALACGPALAQTSQKPIRIIVPFAPGASADGIARASRTISARGSVAGRGREQGRRRRLARPRRARRSRRPTATRSASARPARSCINPESAELHRARSAARARRRSPS